MNNGIKILIAPNSFKECAYSVKVAGLLRKYLKKAGYINTTPFPLSDGGDGFLDVCRFYFKTRRLNIEVQENNGKRRIKKIPVEYSAETGTVFIESARIIGLKYVPLSRRKPTVLSTLSLGRLLKRLDEMNSHDRLKIKKIVVGIGGTATNDLGLGLASVFGLKIFSKGKPLKVIPENYPATDGVVLPKKINLPVEVILDVTAPLYGKQGSSVLFSPQKGAGQDDVILMEGGVKNILNILDKDHNINFHRKKLGAGGGLGVGLSLIAHLTIKSSTKFINKDLGLKMLIKNSDLVITGEGKFDEQSLLKKAAGIVIEESVKQNKICFIITGTAEEKLKKRLNKRAVFFELNSIFGSAEKSIRNFGNGLKIAVDNLPL